MPSIRGRSARAQLPWDDLAQPGPVMFDIPDWTERGRCGETDPEIFYPEKGGSTKDAKKVCLACEVRTECLEYALDNEERYGIWGGKSERERRKIKHERAAAATKEVAA